MSRKPLQSHATSHFFVQKSSLNVHMIGHKLQKNCSIRFENSSNQFFNFDASKGTLLAIARWCHKYLLTFMHKTLILDRCVLSDTFRLAFRIYTVKSPKISVVLSNIFVWLLNNSKLRLFPLLMIKKHSIFWFWSDSESEVFSTRFSLCICVDNNSTFEFSGVLPLAEDEGKEFEKMKNKMMAVQILNKDTQPPIVDKNIPSQTYDW